MNQNKMNDRLNDLEARARQSEHKLRVTWAVSLLAALAMLTIGWHKDAIAQGYGMTLAQASTRIIALETKTASLSTFNDANGYATVRFTGVNVQVVSGAGSTDATVNGVGNLVVGYNETSFLYGTMRSGSHNLVIGPDHDYASYGGFVAGYANRITGPLCSVFGGQQNTASGSYASISGGFINTASGNASSIAGGFQNTASNTYACVAGGYLNKASGPYSCVAGGSTNTASGSYASIAGGKSNRAVGDSSVVSGGSNNQTNNALSTISGGVDRTVSLNNGWVAGTFSGTTYYGNFSSP